MEVLVASAVGILTAAGLYLVMRLRTFPVILGMSLLTYAVNVFLFASGRLTVGAPPILTDAEIYTDPLPQALVLTAIVWFAFAKTGRTAQIDAAAGNAHVGVYILTMIWPAFIFCAMGAAAKFGDPKHVA